MIFKNSNPNLIFYQIIDPTKKICLVPQSYVKMGMSFQMTKYFIMFLSMLKIRLIFANQLSIYTYNVNFSRHQKKHKNEEKMKEIQFSNNILTTVILAVTKGSNKSSAISDIINSLNSQWYYHQISYLIWLHVSNIDFHSHPETLSRQFSYPQTLKNGK